MPRKTKKQKLQAAARTEKPLVETPVVTTKARVSAKYHETGYDKKLRSFTLKDTGRTLVITALLFGLQYFLVLQQDLIKGFFR